MPWRQKNIEDYKITASVTIFSVILEISVRDLVKEQRVSHRLSKIASLIRQLLKIFMILYGT
jgi:hypothetical protein